MLNDSSLVLPDLELQPGDLYVTREPAILRTILGSCVGVTFWNPRLCAGALCHGVLPQCPDASVRPGTGNGFRYVDFSIRYLAAQFDQMGSLRHEVHVKVFGGADVLPVTLSSRRTPTIGAQNCTVAMKVLVEEGFTIRRSDLGGRRGRRIHFHTGTGEVLLQRLEEWKPEAGEHIQRRGVGDR